MRRQYFTDADLIARVRRKCTVTPSGCWEYGGNRNSLGYAQATFRNVRWMVHRFIYTVMVGPISPGMQACHRCDNPPCCNPDHLFLGSAKDNAQDSKAKGRHFTSSKTHCIRGHAYAEHGDVRPDGRRTCRACDQDRYQRDKREGRALQNALKTHCIRGHELAGGNLYIKPNGERQCRACRCAVVKRIAAERASQARS